MLTNEEHLQNMIRKEMSLRPSFMRLPQVLEVTAHGRTSWLAKVAAKKAPQPVKFEGGGRMSCWVAQEVHDWVADQITKHREG